jgi:hypothetical protein
MSSESVEVREEKLPEGAKKIESSELSNQREADILNSTKSLSAWVPDRGDYRSCSSKAAVSKVTTTEYTEADSWRAFHLGEQQVYVRQNQALIILAWWSSSMIPS